VTFAAGAPSDPRYMRILATSLVLLAACSFAMEEVPRSYQPRAGGPPPACSTSGGPILADLAGALASVVVAVAAYRASSEFCIGEHTECERKPGVLIAFGIPAVVYAGSLVHGSRVASECTRVRSEYDRLQRPMR
jgi:hypothetical protein